jgi:hypothetical protein
MFTVVFSRTFSRDILLSTRTEHFLSVRLAPILVCFDCHFFFEKLSKKHSQRFNSKISCQRKKKSTIPAGRDVGVPGNQRLINAFRSMCGIFKRCVKTGHNVVRHSAQREISLWLLVYFFITICLLLREKWPFLSFFLYMMGWNADPVKSYERARSNKWIKK